MYSCAAHCMASCCPKNPKVTKKCAQEEVVARLKETQLLVERFSQVPLPASKATRASTCTLAFPQALTASSCLVEPQLVAVYFTPVMTCTLGCSRSGALPVNCQSVTESSEQSTWRTRLRSRPHAAGGQGTARRIGQSFGALVMCRKMSAWRRRWTRCAPAAAPPTPGST